MHKHIKNAKDGVKRYYRLRRTISQIKEKLNKLETTQEEKNKQIIQDYARMFGDIPEKNPSNERIQKMAQDLEEAIKERKKNPNIYDLVLEWANKKNKKSFFFKKTIEQKIREFIGELKKKTGKNFENLEQEIKRFKGGQKARAIESLKMLKHDILEIEKQRKTSLSEEKTFLDELIKRMHAR